MGHPMLTVARKTSGNHSGVVDSVALCEGDELIGLRVGVKRRHDAQPVAGLLDCVINDGRKVAELTETVIFERERPLEDLAITKNPIA